MSAQPAYRYDHAYRHEAQPVSSPDFRVVPGRRSEGVDPLILRGLRIALALVIAFTALGCVRIAFASATVSASIEGSQISADIESARSTGNSL